MISRSRGSRGSKRKSTVPNLSSRTRSQAQTDLSALGFSYTESQETTSNSSLNLNISSQSVSAGQTVLYGSTISYVYYNYVDPTVYTYGPCQAYDSSTSYSCIGGQQNQATTITYRRRQILANGVWNGSYDECSSTSSTTGAQYTNGICGYTAPTVTYGSCEAYGSPVANLGSGNQCSGTYYQTYTDYRYNTRRQILVNGSWDGSSYDTSGCGTTDVRSITSSSQVNGSCGYTAPPTITYGACEAYGSYFGSSGEGTQCSGTYYQVYEDRYYNGRRKVYSDGVWNNTYDYNCGTVTVREVVSSAQYDGLCGYTAPAPANQWYCTESYNGGGVGNCSYTMPGYNNSASGSGYSRQCVYGTSYPACQSTNPAPVCTSYKYNCKSYDVTNPASNNYFQCYTVGECAANNNSDGSRTTCCASYA